MTTKGFIVFGAIGLAIVLFTLVGFDIVHPKEWNVVALGLASAWFGMLISFFMPGPLTTGG